MVKSACRSAVFSSIGRRLGLFGALGSALSCHHSARQHAPPAASARAAASAISAPPTPLLPPLSESSWLVELDVKGFGNAALAVPLGAVAPRPIVIALHGAADRPEWTCGAFRGIAGPTPFVLCPRGIARTDFAAPDLRYTFAKPDDTARELRAGLAELKRRFGPYVASGSVIMAGFEVGADQAALITRQEPAFFSRVALIAPARESFASSLVSVFGPEGGERVLFACGAACRAAAELKAAVIRRTGVEARAVFLGDASPTLGPDTVSALAKAWPWLDAPSTSHRTPQNLAGTQLPVSGPAPRLPGL